MSVWVEPIKDKDCYKCTTGMIEMEAGVGQWIKVKGFAPIHVGDILRTFGPYGKRIQEFRVAEIKKDYLAVMPLATHCDTEYVSPNTWMIRVEEHEDEV